MSVWHDVNDHIKPTNATYVLVKLTSEPHVVFYIDNKFFMKSSTTEVTNAVRRWCNIPYDEEKENKQ